MSGKWHAFLPTHKDKRDQPQLHEYGKEVPQGHPTRALAIAALEKDLRAKQKRLAVELAETGRALANLLEMKEGK